MRTLLIVAILLNVVFAQSFFSQSHCQDNQCSKECVSYTLPTQACITCRPGNAECKSAMVICGVAPNQVSQMLYNESTDCSGEPSSIKLLPTDQCLFSDDFNMYVSNQCHDDSQPMPLNDEDALKKEFVMSLDFSRFVKKVLRENPQFDNDAQLVRDTIVEYKKFLYLNWKYPGAFSPSKLVDLIWHTHILDTERYMVDCHNIFGYYLHHDPSFEPENEEEKLDAQYKHTLSLYEDEFGASPASVWGSKTEEGAGCGSNCGSTNCSSHSSKKVGAGCGHGCGSKTSSAKEGAGCGSNCNSNKEAGAGCGSNCNSKGAEKSGAGCGSNCNSKAPVDNKAGAGCGSNCNSKAPVEERAGAGCSSCSSKRADSKAPVEKVGAGCGSNCNSKAPVEKVGAGCGSGCGSNCKSKTPVENNAGAGCGSNCNSKTPNDKDGAGCGSGCGSKPSTGDKAGAGCGSGCGSNCKSSNPVDNKAGAGCGHGCGSKAGAGCGHGCGSKKVGAGCGSGCGSNCKSLAGAGCGSGCGSKKHWFVAL